MISGKGRKALVTGASSGIGQAYAEKLASLGFDVLLAARRVDRLEAVAESIRGRFHVGASAHPCDLSVPEDVSLLEEKIARSGGISVLVNNAGFGTLGSFAACSLERSLEMVSLHVTAPTRLVKAVLPGMISRHEGVVVNVSSFAAFLPSYGNVVYSATKAYLTSFSSSLQLELHGTGIVVQALCPGFTRTGFHATPEFRAVDFSYIPKSLWMTPEQVVDISWRAVGKGEVVVVPGTVYRLAYLLRGPLSCITNRKKEIRGIE